MFVRDATRAGGKQDDNEGGDGDKGEWRTWLTVMVWNSHLYKKKISNCVKESHRIFDVTFPDKLQTFCKPQRRTDPNPKTREFWLALERLWGCLVASINRFVKHMAHGAELACLEDAKVASSRKLFEQVMNLFFQP